MRQVSPGLKKWEEEGGKSDGRDSSQHWKGLCVARGMAYLLAHIKASLKSKERNINSNHNCNEEFIADDTTGSNRSFWKLKIIASFWV